MALPDAYTESTLSAYLLSVVRGIAPALGWAAQSDIQSVIDDILLDYGTSDISTATDLRKLRILGRYHIWKAAVEQSAGRITFSVGGQTWNRERLQTQAKEALALAQSEASIYLGVIEDDLPSTSDAIRPMYVAPWGNDPYRSGR